MPRPKIILAFALLSALPVWCQYPGQVAKSSKGAPELRSIAVLEWTGEAGKPKACRLVPVAVMDGARLQGDQLQDGGIYMARPQPLALAGEVEYELEQNGKQIGLFDIKNSGQEEGSWVGYGAWKQLAAPKPKPSMDEVAQVKIEDEDSDRPVLHRKHHADEGSAGSGGTGGSSTGAPGNGGSGSTSTVPIDPDRPTLRKKDTSSDTADASAPATSSNAAPDSDQPTLHRKDSNDSTASGNAAPDDSDRTGQKKSKKKKPEDLGRVESLPDVTDPDRPRLRRGKSAGNGLDVLPTLMGLPADMQQAVAVSDAKIRPEHLWSYSWANPDDEAKMKSALEDIARDALGLKLPAPPRAPAPKRAVPRKNSRLAPSAEPLPPAPLFDEHFRDFELAYGSGATLVLTARTGGPLAEQKFVTLIAQPDFYGNVLVLLKYVADGAHLDDTPRMRLIDAVDAMADNRGELLFELRGATQRQFALYRVLRGQAEKLFVTGGGVFGTESTQ